MLAALNDKSSGPKILIKNKFAITHKFTKYLKESSGLDIHLQYLLQIFSYFFC